MRLPAKVAPFALGLAIAAALALIVWAAYQAFMWFAALMTYTLIGLFVIGFGLDPTVIATPGPVPPTGG